jgi:hypothetical protein
LPQEDGGVIYCKAYQVKDLKEYSGWGGPEVEGLAEDDICYIWEDFEITRSCLEEDRKPLLEVNQEWKDFCTDTLKFEVPADLKGGE